jgi:hypothetical protein
MRKVSTSMSAHFSALTTDVNNAEDAVVPSGAIQIM